MRKGHLFLTCTKVTYGLLAVLSLIPKTFTEDKFKIRGDWRSSGNVAEDLRKGIMFSQIVKKSFCNNHS